jgi:hypothetical protein
MTSQERSDREHAIILIAAVGAMVCIFGLAGMAFGQEQSCEQQCAFVCSISGQETCDACIEACEDPPNPVRWRRPAGRRGPPPMPEYDPLPKVVAVQQLAYDLNWEWWGNPNDTPHPYARWTTEELLDDIASHGINAVKIWFKGDPGDMGGEWCWSPYYWEQEEPFSCAFGTYGLEDMDAVWSHPAIDVYIMRFQNTCWSSREHNSCSLISWEDCKLSGTTFAGEPTYDIARMLLDKYGHLNKTILIGDWEQDWSYRGQNSRGYDDEGNMRFPWRDAGKWYYEDCIEENDYQTCGEWLVEERYAYVRKILIRRQEAVLKARAEFPDAALRVEHYFIFNRYPGNIDVTGLGYTMIDMVRSIPRRLQPDRAAISFWHRDTTIVEALDWAQQELNWPRHRFFVDEFGEWRENDQYLRIYNEGRRAMCWGVNVLAVWTYKQTWCGKTKSGAPKSHSLFYQLNCPKPSEDPQQPVQFGQPRPGMQAVWDLIDFVPTSDECEEILGLPPTRDSISYGRGAYPAKELTLDIQPEKSYPWDEEK